MSDGPTTGKLTDSKTALADESLNRPRIWQKYGNERSMFLSIICSKQLIYRITGKIQKQDIKAQIFMALQSCGHYNVINQMY